MSVCAAIGECDQLCERVGAFWTAEEVCVPALGDGNGERREGGAAEGCRYRHARRY